MIRYTLATIGCTFFAYVTAVMIVGWMVETIKVEESMARINLVQAMLRRAKHTEGVSKERGNEITGHRSSDDISWMMSDSRGEYVWLSDPDGTLYSHPAGTRAFGGSVIAFPPSLSGNFYPKLIAEAVNEGSSFVHYLAPAPGESDGKTWISFAVYDRKIDRVIGYNTPFRQAISFSSPPAIVLFFLALFCVAFTTYPLYSLRQRILPRVEKITEGLRSFSNGNIVSGIFPSVYRDEIDHLIVAFNEVQNELRHARRDALTTPQQTEISAEGSMDRDQPAAKLISDTDPSVTWSTENNQYLLQSVRTLRKCLAEVDTFVSFATRQSPNGFKEGKPAPLRPGSELTLTREFWTCLQNIDSIEEIISSAALESSAASLRTTIELSRNAHDRKELQGTLNFIRAMCSVVEDAETKIELLVAGTRTSLDRCKKEFSDIHASALKDVNQTDNTHKPGKEHLQALRSLESASRNANLLLHELESHCADDGIPIPMRKSEETPTSVRRRA